ncbi:hypothetical protein ACODT5_14805 [Streptomyces sp. 5.8]|uniref:hypothetical protein n=1 Tax=Streptomyces sp. 5.8 TaxID=3406571 RepID=UPI003BB5C657
MPLRPSLLSLRITTGILSVLIFGQVALAGGFLGGHYDMLALHGLLARVLTVVALLTAVAAFFVRRAGGPRSVLPAAIVLVVALVGEIALGLARAVSVHVFLGVVLVSAVVVLTQRVITTPLPAKTPVAKTPAAETPAAEIPAPGAPDETLAPEAVR